MVAAGVVAIVVQRGPDIDGIGQRFRHEVDVAAAAAVEDPNGERGDVPTAVRGGVAFGSRGGERLEIDGGRLFQQLFEIRDGDTEVDVLTAQHDGCGNADHLSVIVEN